MTQTIDQRIVDMQFNNAKFEKGVATSVSSLEKLKSALNLEGAAKGFSGLDKQLGLGYVDSVGVLNNGLNQARLSFSNLQVVGYTALMQLTKGVMELGGRLIKFVGGPLAQIKSGGSARALNIEQARFQIQGLGLDVEEAMKNSLEAVDGTAYGLDQAARATGQLAASGVQLGKDMTRSLRGIAGVAAMTNRSFDDVSHIFTTVAGNGRLMGMQLTQLGTYGINAAAILAEHFGKTEAEIRDMTSKGKVSFEMFSDAMSEAFGEHATKANETYAGSLMNVKAALSRIGEKFYTPYYENMRQVLNSIRPVINQFNKGLDPLFMALEKIMIFSRSNVVKTLESINLENMANSLISLLIPAMTTAQNLGKFLIAIFESLKTAWRSVFPPTSIQPLANLLGYLSGVTSHFALTAESVDKLQRIFKGFFSILDIGVMAVGGIIKIFGELGKTIIVILGPVGSTLLNIAATIGDFFVMFRDALRIGTAPLESFHTTLSKFNESLTSGGAFGKIGNAIKVGLDGIKNSFEGIDNRFLDFVRSVGQVLSSVFSGLGAAFEVARPVFETIGRILTETFDAIKKSFEGMNTLDVLNTGFFAGLIVVLSKVGKAFKISLLNFTTFKINFDVMMKQLGNMFIGWQNQIKAKALKDIAIAIGILAASLLLLSAIPNEKLLPNLTALGVIMAQLMGSMMLLSSNVKMGVTGTVYSLIAFSGAMLILASAVKKLSSIDTKRLIIGLSGISILMWEMVAISAIMSKNQIKMVKGSAGLVMFATALYILAGAVRVLSVLDLASLGKGLGAMGVLLFEIGIFMRATQGHLKGMPSFAAGLILMATALNLLVIPIAVLGGMPWQTVAQGLLALAGILTVLGITMVAMKPLQFSLLGVGASLILFAAAINLLVIPLTVLGAIPLTNIIHGLTAIGGALTIITLGVMALSPLQTSMIGIGAGLILLGVAINLLVGPLTVLGALPLQVIIGGLAALAGIFLILGLAGLALTPVAPTLLILGGAVALIGAGAALAGVGVTLLAAGLGALAISIGAIGSSIPFFLEALAVGMSQSLNALASLSKSVTLIVLETISELGPKFLEAMGVLLSALLVTIGTKVPEIVDLGIHLIVSFLKAISDNIENVVTVATDIIVNFLNGIANGLPRIVEAGVNIVVNFLIGIGQQLPRIVDAGFQLIIAFIVGLTDSIKKNAPILSQAIEDLIRTMLDAAWTIISSPVEGVFKMGADIVGGIVDGVKSKFEAFKETAVTLGSGFLDSFRNYFDMHSASKKMIDEAKFITMGIAKGIDEDNRPVKAIENKGKEMYGSFQEFLNGMFDIDGDTSVPQKEKPGREMMEGVADGITKDTTAETAAVKKADKIVNVFTEALGRIDVALSRIGLEFDLWSETNQSASKGEKVAKEIELLSNRIVLQQDKVNVATAEYNKLLQNLGASNNDTQKSYNKMLQEKITLTKLSNELNNLDKDTTQAYFDYLVQNGKQLQALGYTAAQVEEEARHKTGYGVQVDNMNKTMKQTVEKAVTSAMTAVSTTYTKQAPATLAPIVNSFDTWGANYAESIGDGFINGLKAVMVKVRTALDGMDREVRTTLDRILANMKATMSQISSLNAPTITPVVDMTNVNAAMSSLGSKTPVIEAEVSRIKASALIRMNQQKATSSSGTTNVTNINMTQNNSSPKALSTTDIYRNTKTQLATAKGLA